MKVINQAARDKRSCALDDRLVFQQVGVSWVLFSCHGQQLQPATVSKQLRACASQEGVEWLPHVLSTHALGMSSRKGWFLLASHASRALSVESQQHAILIAHPPQRRGAKQT